MPNEPISCRLHVILAREAPVGVVFRRGPSKWVQLLRWNLEDDTFEPGQWFKGRLYEQRADLSPDGRYLVYFASKQQNWGRTHRNQPDALISWTAVSRPPYLTALALWSQTDTWNGGGLFETNQKLAISTSFASDDLRLPQPEQPVPPEMSIVLYQGGMGEDFPLMGDRLTRDGWKKTQAEVPAYFPRGENYLDSGLPKHWSKGDNFGGRFELIFSIIGYGRKNSSFRQQAFGIRDSVDDSIKWLPVDTDWADWDEKQRLVWAQGGKIWALPFERNKYPDLEAASVLVDLKANQFTEVVSPEWARRW